MTLVEGEELQRLWALVTELSSQLSANRELCHSLQAQADELKGQALHTGTGYTLRRFNTDVSKEKFESELERLNSQLVLENQSLSHENKQINLLLREYEGALESVMSKFRTFSHATQHHTLALTSHYETLLANDMHQAESDSLHASTTFSNTLAHLGGLVRMALREVEGEVVNSDEEEEKETALIDPFEAEGYRVGSPSGQGPSSHAEGNTAKPEAGTRKAKIGYGSAPSRDPRWYGTGGYTGLQGDPEAEKAQRALEARTEEERLCKENETLRELLRISSDITPEIAKEFGIEIAAPPSVSWSATGLPTGKLSLGKARGSRKSIAEASTSALTSGAKQKEMATEASGEKTAMSTVENPESTNKAEDGTSFQPPTLTLVPLTPSGDKALTSRLNSTPQAVSHAVEGAGAPPQLAQSSHSGGDEGAGTSVTASVEPSAKATVADGDLDSIPLDTEVDTSTGETSAPVTDGAMAAILEQGAGRASTLSEIIALPEEEKSAVRDRLLDEAEENLETVDM